MARASRLSPLLREVRACRACAADLPHEPRPVVVAHPSSRVLIVGQAPGRRVHDTGVPWNDPSGDRLRGWLEMSRERFYDASLLAIVPMGLCFPGSGKSGDLPPRPICAPRWHGPLRQAMPEIRLTLLIGSYAQRYYLGDACGATMADTVRQWRDYLPTYFPLPHPSPRNQAWFKHHPWFEAEVLPALRERLRGILPPAAQPS